MLDYLTVWIKTVVLLKSCTWFHWSSCHHTIITSRSLLQGAVVFCDGVFFAEGYLAQEHHSSIFRGSHWKCTTGKNKISIVMNAVDVIIFLNPFMFIRPHHNMQTFCFQMQNRYHDQHGPPNGALSSGHSWGWLPQPLCLYHATADGGSPDYHSPQTALPAMYGVGVRSQDSRLLYDIQNNWLQLLPPSLGRPPKRWQFSVYDVHMKLLSGTCLWSWVWRKYILKIIWNVWDQSIIILPNFYQHSWHSTLNVSVPLSIRVRSHLREL